MTPTIDEVAKLIASDAEASDYLGYAITVDGDTAVVGAYGEDDLGSEAGAAYVFTRDSSGVWSEQQILTAFDGAPGDYFGEAVAVSGDTVLIGAYGDDDMGDSAGSAYVFTRDSSGVWNLQQKLLTSHDTTGEYFGRSVDLDVDTAVISAMGYDYNGTLTDSGKACVFDLQPIACE